MTGDTQETDTSPSPATLLLSSPLYSHVISPREMTEQVCDYCLSRPVLWDHLPPVKLSRCSKCKVPHYCGSVCQKAAWKTGGHRAECKYLETVSPRVPPPLVMLLLRTLARHERDPGYREKLPDGVSRGLEDLMLHSEEVEKCEERRQAFLAFLPVVAACVGDKYSQEQLWRTFCILIINSTELSDAMGNSVGTALSLGLSAMDHSCAPNCNVVFRGRTVEILSLPGSPVCWGEARISYLSCPAQTGETDQVTETILLPV